MEIRPFDYYIPSPRSIITIILLAFKQERCLSCSKTGFLMMQNELFEDMKWTISGLNLDCFVRHY